jgi:DNA-binding GntR family transcriptional regulator
MALERSVTSARDAAYAYVRTGLVEGRLRPGEILDEATIAQEISVSRTPVREALIQLEREGMVAAPPRRRPRVAQAQPDDLALIIAPLGSLQALAAQLAAPHASDDDVTAMRRHNSELLRAIEDDDINRARLADIAFHRVLVNRAGNRFLTSSIDSLEMHTSRVVSLYFRNRGPDGQSAREHVEIIQAVLDGDAGAAARATRRNYMRGLSLAGEEA